MHHRRHHQGIGLLRPQHGRSERIGTAGRHFATVDGDALHARAVAIAAADACGILAAIVAFCLYLTTVDEELSGSVVFVATDGRLVVMRFYSHKFAHRSHHLALRIYGERGVSVDTDALLGRQCAAVLQDQLHVATDDDAFAIGER